jgi:hypothetical protein
MLAFGLVAVVWMSLATASSHGQINFAPPRGANATSPTMSSPDRPAAQPSEAEAVTAHRETIRPAPKRQHATSTTLVTSSNAESERQVASTSSSHSPYASADVPSATSPAVSPAPFRSPLYPVYLRSLNIRAEDSESRTEAGAMRSSDGSGSHVASSPSPPRPNYIHVSSYRVGQRL